jgi:uncharacterized membrane-anchored protein YitT (DUF2179 family)
MNRNTSPQSIRSILRSFDFSRKSLAGYVFILLGAFLQALSLRLFMIPAQLVSGGVSGAAQLINAATGWPVGLMVFVGNIPLFFLGWRFLGGPRFALRTAVAIAAFSFFTDFLVFFVPARGLTNDLVLNTIFGGLLLGFGSGMVYRGQGTSGGSDILGRILNYRLHISISVSYLLTDSLVVLLAGFIFDWTHALYGLVLIYVSGLAAEISSEGSDVFRTALIVTNEAESVTQAIMSDLGRGVTILPGTGGYTGEPRPVLYCVVTRPEVNQLKAIVREADPRAFMVIGQAHEALGEGFRPLK